MSSGWPEPRIGDVGTIVTGSTPSSKTDGNWGDGAAFLTPSDMPDVAYVVHTERRLSAQRTSDLASRLLPSGAVAVSCIASIGKVARITEPTVTNQQVNSLIPDRSVIDANFAFYWLRTLVPQLHQIASGSVAKIVNKTDFSNLTLPLPDMTEQRRIAGVLGALDDLIEVNRGLVRDILDVSLATYRQAVESGSTKRTVAEVANFENNKRVPLSAAQRLSMPGAFPYFGAAGQMDSVGDYLFDGTRVLVGEDGTVITSSGSPVVQFVTGKYWVNNHAHVLSGSTISTEMLRIVLLASDVSAVITGAVQPKLSMGNFKSVPVLVPIEQGVDEAIQVLAQAELALRAEISELEATRDELLPLLMSGRVRVTDEVAA